MKETIKTIAGVAALCTLASCGTNNDIENELKGRIEVNSQSSQYSFGFELGREVPALSLDYIYEKNVPLEGDQCNVLTLWTTNMHSATKGITFIDKGMNNIWNKEIRGTINHNPNKYRMNSLSIYECSSNSKYPSERWENVKIKNLDTMKTHYQKNTGETLEEYLKLIED